jgi:predicted outer membrane lipoprotein
MRRPEAGGGRVGIPPNRGYASPVTAGYAAAPAETEHLGAWARLRSALSTWRLLVVLAGVALAAAFALMAGLWLATSGKRTTSYDFAGPLLGIEIDVGRGDVEILGGGRSNVHVRRTERFAYDHEPREQLALEDGVLKIGSDCARLVVGTCSADYALTIPDNVAVTIRAADGDVRLRGYRGSAKVTTTRGAIAVEGFCGFALQATAGRGDIRAGTACAPELLELRSDEGDVTAVVPSGRYEIDADTNEGRVAVRGVVAAEDAPWKIQALSGKGDVTVAASP